MAEEQVAAVGAGSVTKGLLAGLITTVVGVPSLGVSFFNGMAVATALAVAFTMIASLTLLPALLSLFGLKVLPRKQRAAVRAGQFIGDQPTGFWARWSELVAQRKVIVACNALDEFLAVARDWQARHGRRPILFHSYDWGGYITWHGWQPGDEGLLNWIDDRNEVQKEERVKEYFTILRCEPGWEEKLAKVDLVCVEGGAPLVQRLEERPQTWRKIPRKRKGGESRLAILFERVQSP